MSLYTVIQNGKRIDIGFFGYTVWEVGENGDWDWVAPVPYPPEFDITKLSDTQIGRLAHNLIHFI